MRDRARFFAFGAAVGAVAALTGWALAGGGISPDGGLSWKTDGPDLGLTAFGKGKTYLVVASGEPGGAEPTTSVHAATPEASFSADQHQRLAVYELVPVMEAQATVDLSWGIRPCQPCILPPPPPPPMAQAPAAGVEWWLMAAQ
jgi:hypothetical protein